MSDQFNLSDFVENGKVPLWKVKEAVILIRNEIVKAQEGDHTSAEVQAALDYSLGVIDKFLGSMLI